MKHIILVLALVLSVGTTLGQNKTQEKKINYFVEAAAKEFSLNIEQSKELLSARIAYVDNFMAVNKQMKNGVASGDDKKQKINEINQNFMQEFAKISGKTQGELKPFLSRMREELPNI
jgi:uncharacterized membrane protein YqgA involved in biofilm formation